MKEDLERAYKNCGTHPENMRGKVMKKTVG
jgi:hypothetical protein